MKFVFLLLTINYCWAQHLALDLPLRGFERIIGSSFENLKDRQNRISFKLKDQSFRGVLGPNQIYNNPIIKKLEKFLHLELGGKLRYSITARNLGLSFQVPASPSLSRIEDGAAEAGILAKVKLQDLRLTVGELEICELENERCYVDRKAVLKNLKISLSSNKAFINLIHFSLPHGHNELKLQVNKVYGPVTHKLEDVPASFRHSFAHSFAISKPLVTFENLTLPKIELRVNEQVIVLDNREIEKTLQKNKDRLANFLLARIYPINLTEALESANAQLEKLLNSVSELIRIFEYQPQFKGVLNYKNFSAAFWQKRFLPQAPTDGHLGAEILNVLEQYVYFAQTRLDYVLKPSETSTGLRIDAQVAFFLNELVASFPTTIHHSHTPLGNMEFEQEKDYDFAFALSESLLNGALDLTVESQLIEKFLKETYEANGVSVRSVKVHFNQREHPKQVDPLSLEPILPAIDNTRVYRPQVGRPRMSGMKELDEERRYTTGDFTAVFNLTLDFSKIHNSSWAKKIKLGLTRALEGRIVDFPLELKFRPSIEELNGKKILRLKLDPQFFSATRIENMFHYPMSTMTGWVQRGILIDLRAVLGEELRQDFIISMEDFFSSGLGDFKVKDLNFSKSGHVVIKADFLDVENQK